MDGIPSFAGVSQQFNRIIQEGHCLKDLTLSIYPYVDTSHSKLSIGMVSYFSKLKSQVGKRRVEDGWTGMLTNLPFWSFFLSTHTL